jgi:hypothetical protein
MRKVEMALKKSLSIVAGVSRRSPSSRVIRKGNFTAEARRLGETPKTYLEDTEALRF